MARSKPRCILTCSGLIESVSEASDAAHFSLPPSAGAQRGFQKTGFVRESVRCNWSALIILTGCAELLEHALRPSPAGPAGRQPASQPSSDRPVASLAAAGFSTSPCSTSSTCRSTGLAPRPPPQALEGSKGIPRNGCRK